MQRPVQRAMACLFVGLVFFAAPTVQAAKRCTLMEIETPDDADLRVYFTRFRTEDRTEGKFRRCRIVTEAQEGTLTFFVTPFRQDANLVVHPSNWPR